MNSFMNSFMKKFILMKFFMKKFISMYFFMPSSADRWAAGAMAQSGRYHLELRQIINLREGKKKTGNLRSSDSGLLA
jgi:hypothetical protein